MPARRPDRSEEGTTLVELVVTVAIMGFAMLAIMGGIGTSIIFGSIQRQDATHRLVLTTAAEKILADEAPFAYKECDDKYPAPPAELFPPGHVVTVSRVAFWEPSANRAAGPGRFVAKDDLASCNPGPGNPGPKADNGLQLIELKVTSSSGGSRASKDELLQVVKRQVEP